MNYQQSPSTIFEKFYSMGVQEHSKFTLREILNRQDPDMVTAKYLLAFHKGLTELLDQKRLPWISRTNHRGLTYMCNERKAFIYLMINKKFISLMYFTGNELIDGLKKGNWVNKDDNMGCELFRITDDHSLRLSIEFGLESYKIAEEWEVRR